MRTELRLWIIVLFLCYIGVNSVLCTHKRSIECYLCGHDPSAGELSQESCGTNFRSSVVQTHMCHGACAKSYSEGPNGIVIYRACQESPSVTKDTCVDIGILSTRMCYCFSNLCNGGNILTSSLFLTSCLTVALVIVTELFGNK